MLSFYQNVGPAPDASSSSSASPSASASPTSAAASSTTAASLTTSPTPDPSSDPDPTVAAIKPRKAKALERRIADATKLRRGGVLRSPDMELEKPAKKKRDLSVKDKRYLLK